MSEHEHNWQYDEFRSEPAFVVRPDTEDYQLVVVMRFVCECGSVKLVEPHK